MPDTVPMQLTLDPRGGPLHQQIYQALRAAILRGTFRPGERLPSSRELARDLGISRTTALGAYARLHSEGYVVGNAGAGTRVAESIAGTNGSRIPSLAEGIGITGRGHAAHRRPERNVSSAPAGVLREPRLSSSVRALFDEGKWRAVPRQAVPFASGIPSLELFPVASWTRLAARRWRLSGRDLLLPGDSQGYAPLREAVAKYAVTARGVRCTAEQVVIVNGAQHGIDLCARVLVGPGDDVWLEWPGYTPARGMFAATGARIVDVPVDAQGLDVVAGRALAPAARLAFVTPSYQAPLGTTMSLQRRYALLEWARDADAWILEDDYNGEYRYDTKSVPALQGLDQHHRVLYLGTFSKTLSPAIRLGYLIVPPALVSTFTRARLLLDRNSGVAEQAVLADFIDGGHFARHIRRTRALYRDRHRIFLELAAQELEGLVTFDDVPAGLRLLGWLPSNLNDQEVVAEAARRGVVLESLSYRSAEGTLPPALSFGFAPYTAAQTRAGMRTLAEVIRRARDAAPRRDV
ncbi:MAG: PLP-dependent aminotransferase family protein [Gemmatimonadaceae bacterium]